MPAGSNIWVPSAVYLHLTTVKLGNSKLVFVINFFLLMPELYFSEYTALFISDAPKVVSYLCIALVP